jgi:hypothetical protein
VSTAAAGSGFETIRNTLKSSGLNGDAVANELRKVRDDLNDRGAKFASDRLQSIDNHVDALRYDVIRDVVAPEQVYEELDFVGGKFSRRIGAIRNVLALAPLVLTWIALKVASEAYHAQLTQDPSLVGTPFLDLWQGGFGQQDLGLTFSTTATWDFLLLLFLLLLTILMHIREGVEERRATKITGRLNHALTQLAIALQRHEKIRNESDIGSAAQAAQKAIVQTRDSMREITEANKGVVEQARDSMRVLAESMANAVEAFKDDYEEFVTTQTNQARTTLQEVARQTDDVFNGKLGPNITKFATAAERYEQSSTDLATAATKLSASSDRLVQTTSGMDDHIESLDTNIGKVGLGVTGMTDAAQGVIEINDHMEETNKRLDDTSKRLDYVAWQLGQVSQQLNEASGRLSRAAGEVPSESNPPRRGGWWPFR